MVDAWKSAQVQLYVTANDQRRICKDRAADQRGSQHVAEERRRIWRVRTSLADLEKPRQLTTEEIENFDGVVLDVRVNSEYGDGHIPNSINIGLGGQFASWAGTMIPIGTRIAIVEATQEQVDEAFTRLARVGHESIVGYIFIGDYTGQKRRIEQVPAVGLNESRISDSSMQIVDVAVR